MGSRLVIPLQIAILFVSSILEGQESLPEIHVTLNARNRTINQVLDEITLQTGYNFTYDARLIEGSEKVRFRVEGIPMEEALDSLLVNPRLSYRVIGRNIVIYQRNESPPSPLVPEIDRSVLKGKVIDSRSGKPLDYATIALIGTSLGSVSNQAGEFSFKLPPEIADPILVISYMGYKDVYHTVAYPLRGEIVIALEKETIPLQEVIIRYTDPVALLREALNRIPSNYLQDPSTMVAYYRESVQRNEHCMLFSEAVLDVAKGPYRPGSLSDQVRIRKGRKISDTSTEDTVIIKLYSGIYSSLNLDVIKERPDFLSDDFQDLYDLEFSDMMTYRNRLVYVISFAQKHYITDLMFQGRIYLDQENLAVLAADFEFNPNLIHKHPGLFLISHPPRVHIRPVVARYHVDYRALDGQYHLSQVRAEMEMKVRKRREWFGSRYKISLEMAITGVEPGHQLRISMSDRVKPNTILADQPFDFDPLFWGIYNTIEPEATLMESIQRIEHNLLEIRN
jgi:hypothetical protein